MGKRNDEVTAEELARKYIEKTEVVLENLKTLDLICSSDSDSASEVIEEAKRYLRDAKYYLEAKRFETSLASVAYCEGLLDALRMLRCVDFSW